MEGARILNIVGGIPAAVLLTMHWVGGNALNYKDLARELSSKGILVLSVSLPDRKSSQIPAGYLNSNIEIHVQHILAALSNLDEWKSLVLLPLFLFGHSYGGILAFELSKCFERQPLALIVSGCPSPKELTRKNIALKLNRAANYLKEDNELCSFVMSLQALPVHEAFVRHALPLIRRDYHAFETYDVVDQNMKDTVPILAIYPLGDQVVTSEQCIDWSEYTTEFSYATTAVDGHFYLTTPHGLKELVNLIVNKVFEHMPAAK